MRLTWPLTVAQFLLLVVFLQTVDCNKKPPELISWNQFSSALTQNRFPVPTETHYREFINTLRYAGITTELEAAMFLAQVIHTSRGLQIKEDPIYKNSNKNPYKSRLDKPGKKYYGRGYLMLTWSNNYLQASKDIFGDDTLLQYPEFVASHEDLAFRTAGWRWKINAAVLQDVKKGKFGASTKAINGASACKGKNMEDSKTRFKIYTVVFKVFNVRGKPDESGCYN